MDSPKSTWRAGCVALGTSIVLLAGVVRAALPEQPKQNLLREDTDKAVETANAPPERAFVRTGGQVKA